MLRASRNETRHVVRCPFPFAKVRPRAGMSEKAYVAAVERAPVVTVSLSKIWASQKTVSLSKALMFSRGASPKRGHRAASGALDDHPVVARVGGKLVALNGTHRLAGAFLAGKERVRVRRLRGIL